MMTREIAQLMPEGLVNAELYGTGVLSNIGVLHEEGHKEPWIIAMNATPSEYKVLDYGMRWGIEAMFSDFKTRGVGNSPKPDQKAGPIGTSHPGFSYRHVLGCYNRSKLKSATSH